MKWIKKMKKAGGEDRHSKAKRYWDSDPGKANQGQWTSNPLIGEAVYRRMSGGKTGKHWLTWLLDDYFEGKRFNRMLSPGCGTGDHEILVAESGKVKRIDAFDFSESALKLAEQKRKERGLKINFFRNNLDTFTIPAGTSYDLVLCSGSLHHVKELERFFAVIKEAMTPGGYFVFNEYVGDCYNIYGERQVEIINDLLACFPPELRSSFAPDHFQNPGIEQALASDPSESVRSRLITPFSKLFFHMEMKQPFGGCLLHVLYKFLDHEGFIAKSPERESILKLLLAFEDILMRYSVLDSDFVLCVCRPKP